MVEVLNNLLPDELLNRIESFMSDPERFQWGTVYGSTEIYKTKHFLTYGGGPEGGYVYFYKEREPGWYAWTRDWGTPPTYTKLDGVLVQKFEDYVEYVSVAPYDFEPTDEENDEITILDKFMMEEDN